MRYSRRFVRGLLEKLDHEVGYALGFETDHVILSLDDNQFGGIAIGGFEVFATRQRHNIVLAAMNQTYLAFVMAGSAVDIQLLRREDVLSAQFHHTKALDILWWVLWVELCIEELTMQAGIFDY